MNLALIQAGYTPTVIPPALRSHYLAAVQYVQLHPSNDVQYVSFMSCMVYESTKDYLRLLKASG